MLDLDREKVYFTRHSLSSHLTVFCFWPLLSTDQKAILKGKQLCNITRNDLQRPWPTLHFSKNVNVWRVDLITQGAEDCSTLAMESPSKWQESIMSLQDVDSSPDERPLSCQNYTPTQYSPFPEQTVIPKLAFQATGCLTQSRYFATPPNPAVPWLCCY